MFRFFRIVFLSLVTCLAVTAVAFATDWTVVKLANTAEYSTDGKRWAAIIRGSKVPRHAWIKTAVRSRVKLRRGADQVYVGPHTLLWLTSAARKHGKAKIQLAKGAFSMQVRKGRRKRVVVKTRHLAAVVKGTTFSVSTNRSGSRVSVKSGVVGVTDNATGRSADVGPGQSTSSNGSGGFSSPASVSSSSVNSLGTNSNSNISNQGNNGSNGRGNPGNGNGNGGGNGQGKNGNGNGNGGGNGAGNNGNGNGNGGGNGQGNNGNGNGNGGGNGAGNNGNGNGQGNNANGNGNGGGNK